MKPGMGGNLTDENQIDEYGKGLLKFLSKKLTKESGKEFTVATSGDYLK